jgi:hypothetical protein
MAKLNFTPAAVGAETPGSFAAQYIEGDLVDDKGELE